MDDRFNTIAGWVLFAGIVALGGSIVSGKYFQAGKPHPVEAGGYPIEDADGGAAEEVQLDIGTILAMGDVATGEQQAVARCGTCHTFDQGGANGQGPNLYATMGAPLAGHAGFAYSSALEAKGGTWTWEAMNDWLLAPKRFEPGTTMGFAGLKDDASRASIMLYMNSLGSGLPVPEPAPAEEPADIADTPVVTETEDTPEADGVVAENPGVPAA